MEILIQERLKHLQQYQKNIQTKIIYLNVKQMSLNNIFYEYPLLQLYYSPYSYFIPQYNPNFYINYYQVDESLNQSTQVKNEQIVQKRLNSSTEELQSYQKQQNKKKTLRKKIQDGNYLNKCQKDDRNLNSIVLRNFVNFINNNPSALKIVDEIIKKKNLNIRASYYCDQFRKNLPPRQSYVGVGKIKSFIEKGKLNYEIKLITFILLRKFIDTDFFTVLINSKKVARSAREKQLKHGKKFWREFVRQYL